MSHSPIRKVLIANRGEIAVRIAKTLQEMGIAVVALYSDVDRTAPHVQLANEAYHLPGVKPGETYLQAQQIIALAQAAGVDAIHPGYGFLSENASFAEACIQAGIRFIGPSPEAIRAMGDKIIAKSIMEKAGVPTLPGWSGDPNTPFEAIQQIAEEITYPILVKAAAGGGGKGMRLVFKPEELQAALEGATREAQNAFGDGRVFLEKYVARSRHIEFQIFGDTHGNTVHLFERECSIQRRHQKIVEECPSVALTPELRAQMGEAAVQAARAINYTNAGTVEFLFDDTDQRFYFLEVNTRLQVEHPITELTTHRDLVRLQVQVAAGEPLPFTQAELSQDGHAIECRIYAEDPFKQFMPSIGKLVHYVEPSAPWVRVDSGVQAESEVTVHYDPMLSKLIVWGKTRQDAIEKMHWALNQYVILGLAHNIPFLDRIITHPSFVSGQTHTHLLQEYPELQELAPTAPPKALWVAAALGLAQQNATSSARAQSNTSTTGASPWQESALQTFGRQM